MITLGLSLLRYNDINDRKTKSFGIVSSVSNHSDLMQHLLTQQQAYSITIFSKALPDRVGSALYDALLAHAYSKMFQMNFGGVCNNERSRSRRRTIQKAMQELQAMIQFLGLEDVIPLNRCPTNATTEMLVPTQIYRRFNDTGIFTAEWLEEIHHHMNYHTDEDDRLTQGRTENPLMSYGATQIKVAVHIRRGDTSPCDPITQERYLPNQYYLDVLERYVFQDDTTAAMSTSRERFNVTIYSESNTYERFDPDFENCTLQLDASLSLQQVWHEFLTSDVLILSKSSFSLIPAILSSANRTRVIYTAFWNNRHRPLSYWTVVNDEDILNASQLRINELQATCPGTKNGNVG